MADLSEVAGRSGRQAGGRLHCLAHGRQADLAAGRWWHRRRDVHHSEQVLHAADLRLRSFRSLDPFNLPSTSSALSLHNLLDQGWSPASVFEHSQTPSVELRARAAVFVPSACPLPPTSHSRVQLFLLIPCITRSASAQLSCQVSAVTAHLMRTCQRRICSFLISAAAVDSTQSARFDSRCSITSICSPYVCPPPAACYLSCRRQTPLTLQASTALLRPSSALIRRRALQEDARQPTCPRTTTQARLTRTTAGDTLSQRGGQASQGQSRIR